MIHNLKNFFTLRLRYIAFVIDFLLPTVIIMVLYTIVEYALNKNDPYPTAMAWILVFSLILKDIFGNSFGKRLFGLKIVSMIDGQKPTINQLILRNLLVFLLPIEAFMVVSKPDHRRIGDFLAKTQVVSKY